MNFRKPRDPWKAPKKKKPPMPALCQLAIWPYGAHPKRWGRGSGQSRERPVSLPAVPLAESQQGNQTFESSFVKNCEFLPRVILAKTPEATRAARKFLYNRKSAWQWRCFRGQRTSDAGNSRKGSRYSESAIAKCAARSHLTKPGNNSDWPSDRNGNVGSMPTSTARHI